tara:strand:+ start:728 stop:1090 length:363 start_codon:yes stop_codon:yes gene_type:complete
MTTMNKGTFIFKDSDDAEVCLFLFMKLNKQQMDVALPNSKDNGENGDYFIGIMREGTDYLGKTFYKGIEKIMKDQEMFDLTSLNYNDIGIEELTEEEYTKYKDFADKQMKKLDQIRNLIG